MDNCGTNLKRIMSLLDYPRHALVFFAGVEATGINEYARIVPIRQEQLQERLGENR